LSGASRSGPEKSCQHQHDSQREEGAAEVIIEAARLSKISVASPATLTTNCHRAEIDGRSTIRRFLALGAVDIAETVRPRQSVPPSSSFGSFCPQRSATRASQPFGVGTGDRQYQTRQRSSNSGSPSDWN